MQTKRRFSSYGPVSTKSNYFVPRTELVNKAITQLTGENPEEGGHYFTVWAPRQSGKSWLLREAMFNLKKDERFYTAKINLESLKEQKDELYCTNAILNKINEAFDKNISKIESLDKFADFFSSHNFDKPVILILDEFDALQKNVISSLVSKLRDIYLLRRDDTVDAFHKKNVLHGVALIGVRSVLGIDTTKGSPFNIQKSIHIPNLTFEEVKEMYDDYEREWEQQIEPEVIEKLFYETQGQPGLVSWLGELMVEKYNEGYPKTIDIFNWNRTYSLARQVEPNNTVMNLISKAQRPKYRQVLIEIFNTKEKTEFSSDNEVLNYLYMNGIISFESEAEENGEETTYTKFSSPFIQKRLFNRFARKLFPTMGNVIEAFENIDSIYNGKDLNIKNMIRRFERYLKENKSWLLKEAPRRKSDLKICEATFHFILYGWLHQFLYKKANVIPEFPTGNGKIDILIKLSNTTFGLEIKSFTDVYLMREGYKQAALYAKQLKMKEFYLVIFIESIDDDNRTKYEIANLDEETGVTIFPVFVGTGE